MTEQSNLAPLSVQDICTDTLTEKYLKGDEQTLDELFIRVAGALASVEEPGVQNHYKQVFLNNMRAGGIGAGRIMSAAGTAIQSTLINCFVQPVGDCFEGFEGGHPGIYDALRQAAGTMRRGGGVGYDFSRIRPAGAYVNSTASIASGPCSYIDVFDKSCSTVESAGARRGAQMGVLRIDHPDVRKFITAKRTPGRWNNFNVSVAITDAFMNAVEADAAWDLVHIAAPGPALKASGAVQRDDGMWVYETVRARDLWDTIMRSTYDFAEPGVLLMDNINKDNNLNYCETIAATNPCGEQPLPNYGCCDLGPIILTQFVRNPFGVHGLPEFDYAAFEKAVATQVRMLDNVLKLTFWPLDEQRRESDSKRRIGVGYTGLGNALAMLMLRYDSKEGRAMAAEITKCMRDTAYLASVDLARERGPFPLFDADKYLAEGTFASRLPADVQDAIRTHGIRNSHLLSIAPTGTVSLAMADNASNGVEPPFSWVYTRKKRMADGGHKEYTVEDHAWRLYRHLGGNVEELPEYFVSAMDMHAKDHLAMMAALQPYIDSAISKTVNVPEDYAFEDFKDIYLQAWKSGLKGVATYRPNSVLGSVLSVAPTPAPAVPPAATPAAPVADPMRSFIERRPTGALPCVAEKLEYWTQHEGKKTVYLMVSFMPIHLADGTAAERPIEFFMPVGQSGESQQWVSSGMRSLSLHARGGTLDLALRDMRKVVWDRGPVRLGRYTKQDGTSVPMFHDSEVAAIAYAIQNIIKTRSEQSVVVEVADTPANAPLPDATSVPSLVMAGKKCDECGAHAVIKKDGCEFCTHCGNQGSCG